MEQYDQQCKGRSVFIFFSFLGGQKKSLWLVSEASLPLSLIVTETKVGLGVVLTREKTKLEERHSGGRKMSSAPSRKLRNMAS